MQFFRKNLKWYLLASLLISTVLLWYALFTKSHNDILTVAFLDVGQGDAIFIEAPNGNQMLIDGGPNKKVLRELSKVMPFYDRSIDVIVATHPDKDHIGGLIDVLERFSVEIFLEPGVTSDTGVYRALQDAIIKTGLQTTVVERGMIVALDERVFLKILFPDRDMREAASNDASIIAQLVYGDTEFLLTGDAPQKIEKYLTALDGKQLQSDVLKVGHHGSKTSTAELFLGFVSPEYAVISAGRDNRYGHPHTEVLDLLDTFSVETLNTAAAGTIIFKSDGENIFVKEK